MATLPDTIRRSQDLQDAAAPDHVAHILRNAADSFNAAADDCASAWQDEQAGKVWHALAKILERAADSCDRACLRHGI